MKQTLILPIAIALTAISIVPLMEPRIHNDKAQTQWTKKDSKAYAMDKLSEWQDKQWKCLVSLWGKTGGCLISIIDTAPLVLLGFTSKRKVGTNGTTPLL